MTFATDLAAGLAELRGFAEERMGGLCEFRRLTGKAAQDPVTGRKVQQYVVEASGVPCRVPPSSRAVAEQSAAGALIPVVSRSVHVPSGSRLPEQGWLIVVTDSEPGSDVPAGAVFRVLDVVPGDQATALRIPVESTPVQIEMQEAP